MKVHQNGFTKVKRKRETVKETIDCTPPRKRKRADSERKLKKRTFENRIVIEFNPRNKYLETVILAHHTTEIYAPDFNYPLNCGPVGEELFSQMIKRHP